MLRGPVAVARHVGGLVSSFRAGSTHTHHPRLVRCSSFAAPLPAPSTHPPPHPTHKTDNAPSSPPAAAVKTPTWRPGKRNKSSRKVFTKPPPLTGIGFTQSTSKAACTWKKAASKTLLRASRTTRCVHPSTHPSSSLLPCPPTHPPTHPLLQFLNFFFKQVRRNTTGLYSEYPFISPCGKEMNFILPADMPLVYHDLLFPSVEEEEEEEEVAGKRTKKNPSPTQKKEAQLIYGGDLVQAFDPSAMRLSLRSGRLYHPLPPTHPPTPMRPRFGLLRSHLGLLLADRMVHVEEEEEEEGLMLVWGEEEGRYRVRPLPEEEEPVWGMLPPAV